MRNLAVVRNLQQAGKLSNNRVIPHSKWCFDRVAFKRPQTIYEVINPERVHVSYRDSHYYRASFCFLTLKRPISCSGKGKKGRATMILGRIIS
jgi:hypothetical protein